MDTTDVLGRTLEITRTYPDGSHDCPFCAHPAVTPAERCENPWCPASTYALAHPESVVLFQRQIDAHAKRVQEEEERRQRHVAYVAAYARSEAERLAWEATQRTDAAQRGACQRCLRPEFYRQHATFIRHRGPCPRQGGANA